MKILAREEIDPARPDRDGRAPISVAAQNRHEGVVEILLAQEEVNPGKPDKGGQTPFFYAAGLGNEGVVKILLGREEVDPDKPGCWGQTLRSRYQEWPSGDSSSATVWHYGNRKHHLKAKGHRHPSLLERAAQGDHPL